MIFFNIIAKFQILKFKNFPVYYLSKETLWVFQLVLYGIRDLDSETPVLDIEWRTQSTGHHCPVKSLPVARSSVSLDGFTVCGGNNQETWTSCLTLTNKSWQTAATLLVER